MRTILPAGAPTWAAKRISTTAGGTYDCIAIMSCYTVCKDVILNSN